MKTFKTKLGPFSERPFYSDSDIENMCVMELASVGLLPSIPEPVRIDRFIEKRFKVVPAYQDLGDGILGLTKFTSQGVAEIVVSKTLDEQGSETAERRIRTTLAHEAGHGLLHTHLFVLATNEQPLFGDFSDPKRPTVLCRDEKSSGTSYQGQWWEYQANKAMVSLLMPKQLVVEAAKPFLETRGLLGINALDPRKQHLAARELAAIFDVNPVVARIRLEHVFPEVKGQMTL
jgi:hypothetical protein